FPATALPSGAPTGADSVGVRPEHLELVAESEGVLTGTVDVLEYLGADTFVIVSCGDAGQITVRVTGPADFKPGDAVGLRFDPAMMHAFDAGGLAIR
ncbi:MAG: TOBE domain-containing protein, partial [Pseudomonadota bacterium]